VVRRTVPILLTTVFALVTLAVWAKFRAVELSDSELAKTIRAPKPPTEPKPQETKGSTYIHNACVSRRESIFEAKLCDTVGRPEFFNGKCVRMSAEVLSDGHHGIVLIDGRCPRGLRVWWPETSWKHDDIAAFYKAAMTEWREKTITGRFLGRVNWNPTDGPHGTFLLDTTAISNLKVQPTASPSDYGGTPRARSQ
jgi:hypothetical protein